jgi:prepilin-type N-terminal cleavage/methylation domain-containing protein
VDHSIKNRSGGFSLIELMVAMTVLAVGLLTIMVAQVEALRGGSSGRHTTQAMAIAQSQLEIMQRIRWTSPELAAAGAWTPDVVVNNMVDGVGAQIEQSYNLSWRVTNIIAGSRRAVDVRVRWNERNRPNRILTLSSIRYNHEGL